MRSTISARDGMCFTLARARLWPRMITEVVRQELRLPECEVIERDECFSGQ